MGKKQKECERTTVTRNMPLEEENWYERFAALASKEPLHMLLESGRDGHYSIIGLRPVAMIEGKDRSLMVTKDGHSQAKEGELLRSLEEALAPYRVNELSEGPPIQGGALGYISYDVVREIESIEEKTVDDLGLPDLYFLVFDDLFVYDHEQQVLWLCVNGERGNLPELHARLDRYEHEWSHPPNAAQASASETVPPAAAPKASFTEEAFAEAVEKIKAYIAAGDVFQVNVSVRHTRNLGVTPSSVYEELRTMNPSPYMSYLHTPERQIVSASPELLVRKRGQELSTRPIAGTRSRGANEEEDRRLASELLENEKERAEHVMLVDLERNDLGRVSAYGSVEVDELMTIERYSHVMHLVSNVKGKLAEGYSLYDCIRAVFPGGTITGAPKVRTMEIIEELEPVRRGLYTGAIGWIGHHGDMELNIVIRTMICQEGEAHVQAGAGIVIDSNPHHEYAESVKKAKALWRALELSEEKSKEAVNI